MFYLQVHRLARVLLRKKVLILAYHGFTDRQSHPGIENNHGKHLHIDTFRSHLAYLQSHYNVISLPELVDCYTGARQLPSRAVVITIDDGYRSTYTLAHQALKEYRLPATVFVATDFVDQNQPLWTDRIEYALTVTRENRLELALGDSVLPYDIGSRESKLTCDADLRSRLKKLAHQESRENVLQALERSLGRALRLDEEAPEVYRPLEWRHVTDMMAGLMSIGSHTVSHFILTRCTPETARNELARSKALIEARTGSICRLFCYPDGQADCFDSRTTQLLRDLGYSCGITTVFGMNDSSSNVFELKRLYFDDRGQQIRFIMTISGVVGLLDGIKRRLVGGIRG